MSQIALPAAAPSAARSGTWLFPVAAFASAALVFLVEPMMGRLITPLLGGGAGVWTASLVFFQSALLLGYLYAHLLQRLPSLRRQTVVHLGVLCLAAVVLPLRLTPALGDPSEAHPVAWVLGVLALSVGGPFAALSATAPLLQAWRSGQDGGGTSRSGYGLYAASNLGSLLALFAYPLLVEPALTLAAQRAAWTVGYGAFLALVVGLALTVRERAAGSRATAGAVAAAPVAPARTLWRERAAWLLLAAAPSSLVLGVTTHLAADVGSAPFLWVVPLGVYLVTFVIAFRDDAKPAGPGLLVAQLLAATAALVLIPYSAGSWALQLVSSLAALFLTALVCHLALIGRRPTTARSTEFYLLISVGGVIGGAFNAFVSPVIFSQVWEFPLVLVLASLARPWGPGRLGRADAATLAVGLTACAALTAIVALGRFSTVAVVLCCGAALGAVWLLRARAWATALLLGAVAVAAQQAGAQHGAGFSLRSFYGVHRVVTVAKPGAAPLRELMNGSTLHGAQRVGGPDACTPLTYYNPVTPIGQAFAALHARKPGGASVGAVGLGAGAVAALTVPGDHLRFYEIDPAVAKIARDPAVFTYAGVCAKGRIDYAMGDGRLRLARGPQGGLDMLLIDAFSSDSVPTHLLTVEALRTDFAALKPDGVLVLHLTNRNLELVQPAAAAVAALDGHALVQAFYAPPKASPYLQTSTVLVAARSPAALRAFAADGRWRPEAAAGAPWTDDHIDLLGAFLRMLSHRRAATGEEAGSVSR